MDGVVEGRVLDGWLCDGGCYHGDQVGSGYEGKVSHSPVSFYILNFLLLNENMGRW